MAALKASNFEPATWWVLGICLAFASGMTSNPLILISTIAFCVAVILIAREPAPWSQSLKFYLGLSAFILLTRVAFRIVFNYSAPADDTLLQLPALEINLGLGGSISMLGNVSAASLGAAFADGLRLSAIILSIGLANTLANPRKLLKSTPAALYEIASAISVAINLAPQLIESLQRVRRARSLRGRSKGLGALAGTVIPVLEDTIDHSLALAASMDARGFGRRGTMSRFEQTLARLMSLGSLLATSMAIYLFLVNGQLQLLALALGLLAVAFAAIAVRITSRKSNRTRLIKANWQSQDFAVMAFGGVAIFGAIMHWWLP
ncbi:energy-coupling factor transporter transmembrane component T [Rhodoluna sp.]|uniref:energy-coupling factor transporter transmembrane component T n=1 Tax=Rhodoluna sp. TaxID=1969481 RepID=UPI0025CE7598|nr:energy-coupling factor transporter transmembrane component T [Rhodoluna sp.]